MRRRILDVDLGLAAIRRQPQDPRRLVAADEEIAADVECNLVRQRSSAKTLAPVAAPLSSIANPCDDVMMRLAKVSQTNSASSRGASAIPLAKVVGWPY
jgi:hypothetical protein